jgi:hypothetical protein
MNRFLLMSLASLALGAPAFADDAKAPPAPAAKAAPEAEKPAAADAKVKVDEKKNAQQSKMATCNADPKAKTLKGDARKAFMKECLKGDAKAEAAPAAPADAKPEVKTEAKTEAKTDAKADAIAKVEEKKNAQQSKMAACNADPKAKTLKGAARKDFMKECLKSGPAADAAPAPAPAVAPAPAAAPK